MTRFNASSSLPILLLLLLGCIAPCFASIFPIEARLWVPPFQHAEKIFASNQGPIFAREGNSTIAVDVRGANLSSDMEAWRLVVFFYHIDSLETFTEVGSKIELLACAAGDNAAPAAFPGMTKVQRHIVPVQNASVHATVQYNVEVNGWTDTQIFACSELGGAAQMMPFEGTMTVRNPFGLLPAALYGMLPFSAFITFGYLVLFGFFGVLVVRHRQQIIPLHWSILAVLAMGTAATATCFYAFFRMNETGEPLCCPYPKAYLVSVFVDTLMRTFARVMLVVVCLGYGIVRAKLTAREVISVTLLSIAYFVSGIAEELTRSAASDVITSETPSTWSFVQLLCNLAFIMWINFALEHILKTLADQKQTAKLRMYKSLTYSLAGFVVFFTLLTIVALLNRIGVFDWDVEWEWMQLVAWPVLNFVVSTAMCIIWRPTKNSSQFAFSMQLPMTEDAADGDNESGVNMTSTISARSSSDDDFADNSDDDDDARDLEQGKLKSGNGEKQKAVAAAGEDDDDDDDDGI